MRTKVLICLGLGWILSAYTQLPVLPSAAAADWTIGQAEQALGDWRETVGGFHSDLTGTNAVSYQQLIQLWGTPGAVNDPAYKLPLEALPTFLLEVGAWPGESRREQDLIGCVFEIARAEMLLGNEDFIEVLDQEHTGSVDPRNPVALANPLQEEIQLLEGPATAPINDPVYGQYPQGRCNCLAHYGKAVGVFMQALTTELGYNAFVVQDYANPDSDGVRALGVLAQAIARKVRASKELADRLFARDYNRHDPNAPAEAKLLARQAAHTTYLETAALAAVLSSEGVTNLISNGDLQTIQTNLMDLEQIHSHIEQGLNPFGYKESYVAFRFDTVLSKTLGLRNNYEQMDYQLMTGRNYLGTADTSIGTARGDSKTMRDRMREQEKQYAQFQVMVQNQSNQDEGVRAELRRQLGALLGWGNLTDGLDNDLNGITDDAGEALEPDLVSSETNSGEIGQCISALREAILRGQRIVQQTTNLSSEIEIKRSLLAKLLAINQGQIKQRTGIIGEIRAEKVAIITRGGEAMASFAQEAADAQRDAAKTKRKWGLLGGVVETLAGAVKAGIAAAGTGTAGVVGAVAGTLAVGGINTWAGYKAASADVKLAKDLGSIEVRRARAAALEQSDLVYKEGDLQIRLGELEANVYEDKTNAEFVAETDALFLNMELLRIDALTAEEDTDQAAMRLDAAIKLAERLVADRGAFEQRVTKTQGLMKFYQDPAARVLEDQLILKAGEDFRLAAEMVYLTGKAMEYEINGEYPGLHNVFAMRTVKELGSLVNDLYDAYSETFVLKNPAPTTRTLSLRQDLLGLSLPGNGSTLDDLAFRDFIAQHLTPQGDLYIQFDTYLTVGNYADNSLPPLNFFGQLSIRYNDSFPQDHWNERIVELAVNINGMENVGRYGASASLTQWGTTFSRSPTATVNSLGYIDKDDVRAWDLEPRTTGQFTASVDEHRDKDGYYFNDQLVARSVAACDWRLIIYGLGATRVDDLLGITDIEIIIRSDGYVIQR